ncbi:MAG: M20 family metallopeptidase [Aggregatilineales bacterium]
MVTNFRDQAQSLSDELVERRRDLHRHPELAFEEFRTAKIVAETLTNLGLEVQTGIGKTGVVALLDGDKEGPTVLVRADMDALPINEENSTDYVSETPNKMHACGHDGHTTIALGVAKLFAERREDIHGRIKFVFQPAEEIVRGAKAMIDDGALTNPTPDVSLGLHLWNSLPLGKVGVASGAVMAGSSTFKLIITGHGGHAASPHSTIDPVICAAQLIIAFQTIVSRNADPMASVVLSTTQLKASDADNIIPERVEVGGTFRTFSIEMRDLVETRIREISESICKAMGCTVDVTINHGTIPTVNHADVVEKVRNRFVSIVGEENLLDDERTMGSEDVAYFMQDIPGMYFFVGSSNAERDLNYGHHHPRFDFDEAVLPLSVELLASAIAEYVLPE